MAKWYEKGVIGEFLLREVESLLDGVITEQEFVARCKRAGLNDAEILEILSEDEKYA